MMKWINKTNLICEHSSFFLLNPQVWSTNHKVKIWEENIRNIDENFSKAKLGRRKEIIVVGLFLTKANIPLSHTVITSGFFSGVKIH